MVTPESEQPKAKEGYRAAEGHEVTARNETERDVNEMSITSFISTSGRTRGLYILDIAGNHTIMYMLQETGFTRAGCKLGVKGPNGESKDIRFKMAGLVFLLVKM